MPTLEIIPYVDKPERLTVRAAADGVRVTGADWMVQMTLPVARSLAYRLLAIAEEE